MPRVLAISLLLLLFAACKKGNRLTDYICTTDCITLKGKLILKTKNAPASCTHLLIGDHGQVYPVMSKTASLYKYVDKRVTIVAKRKQTPEDPKIDLYNIIYITAL